jgi:chromosome segregation ATPase
MGFLELLRGDKPAPSAHLREALAEAEAAAEAGAARVAAAVEARRQALLGGDDKILDRVEQEMRRAEREADRADTAAVELRQRLTTAEMAEAQAALDQAHEQGQAALRRGVELVREAYPKLALPLKGLAEELRALDEAVTAANERLARAGDPRQVPAIDATARPQGEHKFLQDPLWWQLRLPSSEQGLCYLHPGLTIFGEKVAEAQRPKR